MSSYKIIYSGKDITSDLSGILVNLKVIDRLEGKAGDLEIELEDHNNKFMGDWYPETDDNIEVWIGTLNYGSFWVDTVENHGDRNGRYCTIKAMSVKMKAIVQGRKLKSYRGKSLSSLAQEVANNMGLTVKGTISGMIKDNCIKNDLEFLSEQATKLGYIMKIDSGSLVFSNYEDLKKQKSLIIYKKDVESWSIEDKAIGRYSKCTCNWYDAVKKVSYTGSATLAPLGYGEANIWEEVESNAEAVRRAKDWLIDKNKQQAEITLDLVGDERYVSGIHIEIPDFGKKSGNYIIKEATHQIDRTKSHKTTISLQK